MEKRLIGLLILAVSIGMAGIMGTWNQADAQNAVLQSLSKPMPLPDFSLPNLQGQEVVVQKYLGKVLLLNFWSTWCTECRKEAPFLEKLNSQMQNKDFILFRIDTKESQKVVQDFLKENPTQMRILLDGKGKIERLFGVWAHPTSFLIDRRGYVRYRSMGVGDWVGIEALSVINKLLEEEGP
jgi:peroxiredoxin